MRLRHFDEFAPRCPACVWRARGEDVARAAGFDCVGLTPLELERIESREGAGPNGGGIVVHGVLRCRDRACQSRYPVIDGVPMIVANVRELLQRDGVSGLMMRSDLPSGVEAYVAEALGQDGAFDRERLYAGAYAWDHYGTGAANEGDDAVRVMRRLVAMGKQGVGARVLDVGCATGGVGFELGAMTGDAGKHGLVLGIDMHLTMLRVAQGALRTGVAVYPLRREGVVYDRVRVAVGRDRMANAERVDFWCVDALVMPIASGRVDTCVALHTLDSVGSPAGLLAEMARVTRSTSGRVLLASPFDWTQRVTPMEHWLGGHASGAPHGGESASVLEWLLGGGAPRGSGLDRLRILERDDMEWRVRLYARGSTHYRTHLLACEVRDSEV